LSSTLLDAQQVTAHRGARCVLDGVDLRGDGGSRIGLIGPNGAGKSTLLRILAEPEAPDGGAVRRLGTVGYLPQLADARDRPKTVRQTILDRVGLTAAGHALDRWASALGAGDLDSVGAARRRARALAGPRRGRRRGAPAPGRRGARAGDRLPRPTGRRPVRRAGCKGRTCGASGRPLRRSPARRAHQPSGCRWPCRLAVLLRARSGGTVIVSHDRALLTESVSEILELDRRTGKATRYRGGWDAYERERAAAHRSGPRAHRSGRVRSPYCTGGVRPAGRSRHAAPRPCLPVNGPARS
jgi:ABC transporter